MTDSLRTRGPTVPREVRGRAEARLGAACAALCPEPRLDAAASLLAPLVEWTGAARSSILALNPATGRLAIMAAVGLREDLLGRETTPGPRSISEWVFRNRRSLILNGKLSDQRFVGSAATDGIESALSLPLVAAGDPIGVVNLARFAPAPIFDPAEVAELEPLLEPVAAALARLLRTRGALRAGADLARRSTASGSLLLPRGRSEPRCYELALAHRASAIPAGDLCDRVPHAGGEQSLLVLDPPGLGGTAAATAAFLHGAFVTLAAPERSAAGMAARLGSELHQRLGPERATAAWIAQLSTRGEVSYCNAGHAWPLWLPADGSEVSVLHCGGPLLGALPTAHYEEECLRLLPGDVVLVPSNGVISARGNADQPFGSERLFELLASLRLATLERLVENVLDTVIMYSGRPVPTDDLTVLALRFRPEE